MNSSAFTRSPLAALPLALLLSACAVTKVEPPPPMAAPAQFKETGLWQQAAKAPQAPTPDQWWTLFNDPVLDDLQQRLVIGNENLKAAVAQVKNARAAVDASSSAGFPTLAIGATGARTGNPLTASVSNQQNPSNAFALTASAGWEIDLWDRLGQATTGARASLQASVDDLAAARLSAQATLAQTYFAMRATEAQQSLYERSVAAFQRSLELTQVRYAGGVASRSDVLQAQTQLKNAQAQLLEATAQRAQLEHAIAVLLGLPPAQFELARNDRLPTAPTVPELLPARLLERRPDIAAAQSRVAAAYAQIGVADAAYFPSLSLSANAGFRRSSLADLISAPNLFWSIGPSLALDIFDGGQRKFASAQARANAEAATANYRQAVLTALQEVEDNLVLADSLQREAQLRQEAAESSLRDLEITMDQYRAGTVSYLNVVIVQTVALNAQVNLLNARNRQLAAVNQLLKNIAGRWDPA